MKTVPRRIEVSDRVKSTLLEAFRAPLARHVVVGSALDAITNDCPISDVDRIVLAIVFEHVRTLCEMAVLGDEYCLEIMDECARRLIDEAFDPYPHMKETRRIAESAWAAAMHEAGRALEQAV